MERSSYFASLVMKFGDLNLLNNTKPEKTQYSKYFFKVDIKIIKNQYKVHKHVFSVKIICKQFSRDHSIRVQNNDDDTTEYNPTMNNEIKTFEKSLTEVLYQFL